LAVRFAAGTDDLAQLVRKDQDLSAENERLDKDLVVAVSKPPNQRDANREAAPESALPRLPTVAQMLAAFWRNDFPITPPCQSRSR
jgi:hypothetical protein